MWVVHPGVCIRTVQLRLQHSQGCMVQIQEGPQGLLVAHLKYKFGKRRDESALTSKQSVQFIRFHMRISMTYLKTTKMSICFERNEFHTKHLHGHHNGKEGDYRQKQYGRELWSKS